MVLWTVESREVKEWAVLIKNTNQPPCGHSAQTARNNPNGEHLSAQCAAV